MKIRKHNLPWNLYKIAINCCACTIVSIWSMHAAMLTFRRPDGTEYLVPNYEIHDFFADQEQLIKSLYDLQTCVIDYKGYAETLKPKNERKCMFCGLRHPETTFKKNAHQISRLLGAKYSFYDLECDKCNAIFGQFETDLDRFIGVEKMLHKIKTNSKRLEYNSSDKTNIKWVNDSVLINGVRETIFSGKKHPYVPLNVYKAFLKIALSILPDYELEDYKFAIDFLFDDKTYYYSYHPQLFDVVHTTFPGIGFRAPSIFLLKKKDQALRAFTHTACFYFLNSMFQIYLPINPKDEWLYDNKNKISHYICPPMVDKSYFINFGLPTNRILNMYSKEKVKYENEEFYIGSVSYSLRGFPYKIDLNAGAK